MNPEVVMSHAESVGSAAGRQPVPTHVVLLDENFEAIGTVSLPTLRGKVWKGTVRLQPLEPSDKNGEARPSLPSEGADRKV